MTKKAIVFVGGMGWSVKEETISDLKDCGVKYLSSKSKKLKGNISSLKREISKLKSDKIVLVGWSYGGLVCLGSLLEEEKTKVSDVVLLNTNVNLKESWKRNLFESLSDRLLIYRRKKRYGKKYGKMSATDYSWAIDTSNKKLVEGYSDYLRLYASSDFLKQNLPNRVKYHFLAGGFDSMVTIQSVRENASEFRELGKKTVFKVIEGDHWMNWNEGQRDEISEYLSNLV